MTDLTDTHSGIRCFDSDGNNCEKCGKHGDKLRMIYEDESLMVCNKCFDDYTKEQELLYFNDDDYDYYFSYDSIEDFELNLSQEK
jgi:hypothetical protein